MPKTFVGSQVRQPRGERGFSQAALAQMLEISPSYLNQVEHDVRPLTVAVLLRITEVFGVDATFFSSRVTSDESRRLARLSAFYRMSYETACHRLSMSKRQSDGRNHMWVARAVERRASRYGQPG